MRSVRGHILGSMRLAALVMAMVVGAAPAALTACEMTCASTLAESAATPGHACHGTPHEDRPSITTGSHVCGHEDEMPPAGKVPPPDVAVSPCSSLPIAAREIATPLAGVFTQTGPPGPLQIPLPLRI